MSFSRELKQKSHAVWEQGYMHPFVQQLGQGTLSQERFQFYLLQDHHYLLAYAKVFALATLKSDTEELMTHFTAAQHGILATEMNLHRAYMASYGISPEQVQAAKPSLYSRTYTANMLTIGQTGDLAELLAAVFPCAWTYADYAARLRQDYAPSLAQNDYREWIDTYAGEDFAASFAWMFGALDELCRGKSPAQLRRVEDAFVSSVEFEYLFWDMAYKQELSHRL